MIALVATALVLCFPAIVLAAAVSDATSFTIPNWMSLALLAIFPVAALAVGVPLPIIGVHFGVGAAVLVAGIAMFALRWIGGGDAKLLAATALWVGLAGLPELLLGATMTGGGLAMILLTLRSAPMRPVVLLGPRWVTRLAEPGEGIPYGVAIAVGAVLALPASAVGKALGL